MKTCLSKPLLRVVGLALALGLSCCGEEPEHVSAHAAAPAPTHASASQNLLGAPFDAEGHHVGVGALVRVDFAGTGHDHCSATLIAPDVVLTAAHCVPEAGLVGGLWLPLPALGRLYWVPAERPWPLGRNARYQVRAAVVPPAYSAAAWDNYASPLYARAPRNFEESLILAAFEEACGSGDRYFDRQQRLACLTTLPPALQRALGVPDADHNLYDIALMFLDREVAAEDALPLAVADALVPGELAPSLAAWLEEAQQADAAATPRLPDNVSPRGAGVKVVGYGYASLQPNLSWLWQAPTGRRTHTHASVWAVGAYQMQLQEDAPICWGDSGGPVLQRQAHGAWAVVGVASSMLPKEPRCSRHGLYMRADVFKPWLAAQMALACEEGLRPLAACRRP